MEGQGTELNIYRLLNRIERLENTPTDEKTWILFVDFAKAYDVVNHKKLFEKMKKLGISEKVIQGVKFMFNNLVIDSGKKLIKIGRGLGQGWSISCLLFNIFTDDLTDEILKISEIYP